MKKISISVSAIPKATLNKNVSTTYELLVKTLSEKKNNLNVLGDSDNPQVQKMRESIQTELFLIQSVLDSLSGNHVSLKIMSR